MTLADDVGVLVRASPISESCGSDNGDWHPVVGTKSAELSAYIAGSRDGIEVMRGDKGNQSQSTIYVSLPSTSKASNFT